MEQQDGTAVVVLTYGSGGTSREKSRAAAAQQPRLCSPGGVREVVKQGREAGVKGVEKSRGAGSS